MPHPPADEAKTPVPTGEAAAPAPPGGATARTRPDLPRQAGDSAPADAPSPAAGRAPADPAARLLIGPVLRRVAGDTATIWVETSAPATVAVQAGPAGGTARTFRAFGHHYALVVVRGLPPAAATPYQVSLDGDPVWPDPDTAYPPSVIVTPAPGRPVRLVFGSCREATATATDRRLPPDALDAYARRLAAAMPARPAGPAGGAAEEPAQDWPDTLVLLGDQVYADRISPRVRRSLHRRALPDAPADQVVTFDEYTRLYLESWRDPEIRWLLSTVPSVMIFDDHEIIDDWNGSASWRARTQVQPWWPERIASGLASYWVYQHLGNLHPDQLAADPVYTAVRAADDATEVLRAFGGTVDQQPGTYRWSFRLDLGGTRLVVLDNRCARVLDPGGRAMLPEDEWRWFVDQTDGRYEHLLVGSSLPWLLPPAFHHIEAWYEQVTHPPVQARAADGLVARAAERLGRRVDLEHWAAFGHSFGQLTELFTRLGTAAGHRPASICVLSGDVHHSYVARADLGRAVASPVYQLTCSPIHNQVETVMRPALRLGWSPLATMVARGLARLAGVAAPVVRWRKLAGPYFGNAVATLTHTGPAAHILVEGTTSGGTLHPVTDLPLT